MARKPEPRSYDELKSEISRYLQQSVASGVLIVNCETQSDLARLYDDFAGVETVTPKEFCNADFPPQREAILARMTRLAKPTLFKHLSPFWRLKGSREINSALSALLSARVAQPALVATYQLEPFLTSIADPRQTPRILLVGGSETSASASKVRLLFADHDYLRKGAKTKGTLDKLGEAVESAKTDRPGGVELVFATKRRSADYPDSLLPISDLRDARSALVRMAPELATLEDDALEDADWREVWEEVARVGSWSDLLDETFGGHSFTELLRTFEKNDPFSKSVELPIFFLALKLYAPRDDSYLGRVVAATERSDKFFENLYSLLLATPSTAPEFQRLYSERRALLGAVVSNVGAVARARFLTAASAKGVDALYYMTDRSCEERRATLKALAQYGAELGRARVLEITKQVYPHLHDYLTAFPFDDERLRNYFKEYQFLKVVNRLAPEFLARVDELARNRDYNASLPKRSAKLGGLDRANARVYFVDALGVEYLSFLQARANDRKLSVMIDVCRSEVPTTTECNADVKEFLNENDVSVNVLDEIKHGRRFSGKDKRSTEYIEDELEQLAAMIEQISVELNQGTVDRVYIVSDHGASRLAVLYDPQTKVEMKSRGERSGRCCRKDETDAPPEGAMDAGEWWAFANYERFKGSRKAEVETHGGASLEEICTPIIELKLLDQTIAATLGVLDAEGRFNDASHPTLQTSFREKNPTLYFRTSRRLRKPRVFVDGQENGAPQLVERLKDANVYAVTLVAPKKGEHSVRIFDDATRVEPELTFEIASGGITKNSIL